MAAYPYIGARISLISKSDMRYEGTLFTIDPANSTVALSNVTCFGTENRLPNITPPSDSVYQFLVFKGADIKNLVVCEQQEDAGPPPPDDPAILGTTAPSPSNEASLASQMDQLAVQNGNTGNGSPPSSSNQWKHPQQGSSHGPWNTSVNKSEANPSLRSTSPNHAGGYPPQQSASYYMPSSGPYGSYQPAGYTPAGYVPHAGPYAHYQDPYSSTSYAPQYHDSYAPAANQSYGAPLRSHPPSGSSNPHVQADSQEQTYTGPGSASYIKSHQFARSDRGKPEVQPRSRTGSPDKEFDIQSSNARFDKELFTKQLQSPSSSAAVDPDNDQKNSDDRKLDSSPKPPVVNNPVVNTATKYNRESSFFDDLSHDRDERSRDDRRRGRNEETFGDLATGYVAPHYNRGQRSRRGRGGGDGRNAGNYQNEPRPNQPNRNSNRQSGQTRQKPRQTQQNDSREDQDQNERQTSQESANSDNRQSATGNRNRQRRARNSSNGNQNSENTERAPRSRRGRRGKSRASPPSPNEQVST